MQKDQNENFPNEIKKQLISRVEEMLKSGPSNEDEFRFLIVGNEESQKPLLSNLLRVEKIVWPPNALSILYNTLRYKAKIEHKEHQFQLYFLSNIEKLKENFELFNEACVHSDAIVIFYNPNDQEDFIHAAEIGKELRNRFKKKKEIFLTAGSENYSILLPELERLEKDYQINNYDDQETLIPIILVNVLKRKKKVDQKRQFMKNELKKIMDQLGDQKTHPDEILDKMDNLSQSMHGEKVTPVSTVDISIKKEIIVFVSYVTKDAEPFKIKEIANTLNKYERIKKVLYWERDTEDNIQKYMSDSLNNCDVLLLFCSPNALVSKPVEDEWTAANTMRKPIIPIFNDANDIPPLLKPRKGVRYNMFDLQKNIDDIYEVIITKTENVMVDKKDLKTDF